MKRVVNQGWSAGEAGGDLARARGGSSAPGMRRQLGRCECFPCAAPCAQAARRIKIEAAAVPAEEEE